MNRKSRRELFGGIYGITVDYTKVGNNERGVRPPRLYWKAVWVAWKEELDKKGKRDIESVGMCPKGGPGTDRKKRGRKIEEL